jgi:hypothetical protein
VFGKLTIEGLALDEEAEVNPLCGLNSLSTKPPDRSGNLSLLGAVC